jgi:hypothetical protein
LHVREQLGREQVLQHLVGGGLGIAIAFAQADVGADGIRLQPLRAIDRDRLDRDFRNHRWRGGRRRWGGGNRNRTGQRGLPCLPNRAEGLRAGF